MASGQATQEALYAEYASNFGMDQLTFATWWTWFQWHDPVPEWGGVDGFDRARIEDNGVYMMTWNVAYHLKLPVEGDYRFSLSPQLRAASQVIGYPGIADRVITAPPGTSHADPYETDLTLYGSDFAFLGQQWYGQSVDIVAPAVLAIPVNVTWSDAMRVQFDDGDELQLIQHDNWNFWSIRPAQDAPTPPPPVPVGSMDGSAPRTRVTRVGR